MTTLTMYRKTLATCSIGMIVAEKRVFPTIERPWLPVHGARGGKPFQSCIPFGNYRISNFSSDKFGDVWALSNPSLGVFVHKDARAFDTDRYACLIHTANWVTDVVGCIGAGQGMSYDERRKEYMVTKSSKAIGELREIMGIYNHLEILPYEPK